MKRLCVVCVIPLAACVGSAKFSSFSSSSSGASSSGSVTIPNVFKLPKDQAIAALKRAGVQGSISEDSGGCGSIVEGQIIELNEICYQHPPAGRSQGARLPVSIRVQTQDPRRGNIGTHNEWRLMPKLVGLTFEQAIDEMKRAGFVETDKVQHVWADETSCKPLVVCRQYPEHRERAGLHDGKVVYVGQDRSAKPAVATSEPVRTTVTPTGPIATTTTTPSTPRKRWGGDGSPPSRDEAKRPRGPGGPVFMGKGEPCTNKIDHCMRPGVWFAASDVTAGKLFRGTPVFELEGKWWNWRGDEADYKFLFKTKVATSASDIFVGKPIVWLVEDSGRKWLDNEHDMLTTSRWSVGVVESIDGETIRVKGWSGNVSLDTIRVIVEEKQQTPSAPSPGDMF